MTAPSTISMGQAKQMIAMFLRLHVSTEEAEAMVSPGFRAIPCGGCGRQHCQWCSREPGEVVRVDHGKGKRAEHDPKHVRVILQRFGVVEPVVMARVPGLLRELPPLQATCLLLEYGVGMDTRSIARVVHTSASSVIRHREKALEQLARWVWPTIPD